MTTTTTERALGDALAKVLADQSQWGPALKELLEDDTEWQVADIATMGTDSEVYQRQTIRVWRRNALRLLPEDMTQAEREAVTHAEFLAHQAGGDPEWDFTLGPTDLPFPDRLVFGHPVWAAGRIRLFFMQTGRMRVDGTPVAPGERKSPGAYPRAQTA